MKNLLPIFCILIIFGCESEPSQKSTTEPQKPSKTESPTTPQPPLGWRLGEYYASDDTEFFFCDDSTVVLRYFYESWYFGKWKTNGDSVIMNFYKEVGDRGIGEPLPAGPGNSPDEFSEYVDYVYEVDTAFAIHLPTVYENLKENGGVGQHVIYSKNVDCDLRHFDRHLPGDYTFASMRELTKADLAHFSKKELRLIRNEIYARYHFIFKSKDLQNHFLSKSWYQPMRENADKYLDDLEKKNLKLIKVSSKS